MQRLGLNTSEQQDHINFNILVVAAPHVLSGQPKLKICTLLIALRLYIICLQRARSLLGPLTSKAWSAHPARPNYPITGYRGEVIGDLVEML
jgi:hypothetical protein